MSFHSLHVDTAVDWRGGQRQLFLLAKGQQERGLRVTVACPPHGVLSRRLKKVGIATLDIPPGISLRGRFRVRGFNCSLVAAHSSHAHSICLGVRGPLVVHRRVDFKPKRPQKYAGAKVIAVSNFIAAQLKTLSIDSVVVYDGIELPASETVCHQDIDFLSVGALVPHKGHRVLAQAALRFPDHRIVVLGAGALRYDALEHLGWVSDVAPFYRRAGCFVHPSIDEGLGQSVLEAMAHGLPVVASRAGGIPEIVGDAGVLVEPNDPVALAEGMRFALNNRAELAEKSRLRCRLFLSERMIDETLACYQELIQVSKSPS